MSEKMSFESMMLRLQEIVSQLERNDQDLDRSIALFEEGLKLIQGCDTQLKNFEDKISTLISEHNVESK
jgi:exodeoxyribonuclease VII small subunit